MNKKFLGLGSNEGNRREFLNKTLTELNKICEIVNISPVYETLAQLPKNYKEGWDKPFLNLVVQIQSNETAPIFLKKIKSIENQMDRINLGHWSPRTIDIDILFWGDEKYETPDLSIPHPLLRNRSFVLDPLKDLDGDFLQEARAIAGHQPLWMKIINITPDSFSNNEQAPNLDQFKIDIIKDFQEGVHIFDLGAESTRPNAKKVNANDEWNRLEPYLLEWKNLFTDQPIQPILSLDTYKAECAKKALPYGINIINDVSGLQDPEMINLLTDSDVDYVLTHSMGVPANVKKWDVENPILSMKNWLEQKLEVFNKHNISNHRLYFDPGIGFGKSTFQSLSILNNLEELKSFPIKLLVGHSRKSFMTALTSQMPPQRDIETLALSSILIQKGVEVLRIHNSEIHIRAQKVRGYVQSRTH